MIFLFRNIYRRIVRGGAGSGVVIGGEGGEGVWRIGRGEKF